MGKAKDGIKALAALLRKPACGCVPPTLLDAAKMLAAATSVQMESAMAQAAEAGDREAALVLAAVMEHAKAAAPPGKE